MLLPAGSAGPDSLENRRQLTAGPAFAIGCYAST
jgi:hypothetical protein